MVLLTEEQESLLEVVADFAKERIAPHALQWDADKHFPVDILAEAGELGLGGIYAAEDFGGGGLSRQDAVLIFEELAKADPALAAYISIHNMVVWMIDSYGKDRKSTRLNSSHVAISYAVFCLKKKTTELYIKSTTADYTSVVRH